MDVHGNPDGRVRLTVFDRVFQHVVDGACQQLMVGTDLSLFVIQVLTFNLDMFALRQRPDLVDRLVREVADQGRLLAGRAMPLFDLGERLPPVEF